MREWVEYTWSMTQQQETGKTSEQYQKADWYIDRKWKMVFAHDRHGQTLSGSIQDLKKAISEGRRVRFQLPWYDSYTVEADSLYLAGDRITAQALKSVDQLTSFNYNKPLGPWIWLMVSTSGRFNRTAHDINGNKNITQKFIEPIKWFVDTENWELALETDANGTAIKGSKSELVRAIRKGSPVRCVDSNHAFTAQNLAIQNHEVAAQTTNQLEVDKVFNTSIDDV